MTPEPNPESAYEIFLSYAREDGERARSIRDALGRQGWSVFMDREIPNAERWEERLQRELACVPCIVVLWSAIASQKRWVNAEAQIAADRHVLVQLSLDGTPPPGRFSELQMTDLSTWDGTSEHRDFVLLLRAVAGKIGSTGALGTLRQPQPYEPITTDHVALTSTSWRHDKPDLGAFPFQIHLRLVGSEAALRRIENVVYYFDPAYALNSPGAVDTILRAYVKVGSDWRTGFRVYELANGYSIVRAAVKVRDQAAIVELSRIVDIVEKGPRLDELYPISNTEKAG